MTIETWQDSLRQAVRDGNKALGSEVARSALAAGLLPLEFFQQVIEPVLTEVGDGFSRLELFLPDLMRAGMVIKAIQEEVLGPAIRAQNAASTVAGKVVIGSSQGDVHDIGKNMVSLMLQVNGFAVTDLGVNISPRRFIEAAQQEGADIIAISSLLTPSLPYIRDVVKLLEGYNLRQQFMVVAGGAAATREWAKTIGIDGYGEDAIEAVQICRQIMANRREQN